jgi:hypothetical protein
MKEKQERTNEGGLSCQGRGLPKGEYIPVTRCSKIKPLKKFCKFLNFDFCASP